MLKRKVAALVLAISAALSLTATANAEDTIEQRETVRVGNYECWVENGEYYTEINGEVGLVIDISDTSAQSDDAVQTFASNEVLDWENNAWVLDMRDDTEYHGYIDLRNHDDYTPIFLIDTGAAGFASFKFRTEFIFANTYSITIHTYNDLTHAWDHSSTRDVIFSCFVPYMLIVNGTETPYVSKCCIYFNKEGSTGEDFFYYYAKQVKYK